MEGRGSGGEESSFGQVEFGVLVENSIMSRRQLYT